MWFQGSPQLLGWRGAGLRRGHKGQEGSRGLVGHQQKAVNPCAFEAGNAFPVAGGGAVIRPAARPRDACDACHPKWVVYGVLRGQVKLSDTVVSQGRSLLCP